MSRAKKVELSEFTCKPCRGRGGFEFVPKGRHELDLVQACTKLRAANAGARGSAGGKPRKGGVESAGTAGGEPAKPCAEIEAESPYLAIVKFRGARVTIFRSGKVLVKGVKEEGKAREIAGEIAETLH
ncbi:MAG: hypothetical protein V1676_07270 [Candidatus Diapherotrites archaeon]